MTRASSLIAGYTSRHCDGTAGVEYFADGIAFAWTGREEDLIEISPGAYGEAVEYLIPSTPLFVGSFGVRMDFAAPWLLAQFTFACDQWLAWNAYRNQPGARHRPEWSQALKTEVCSVCLVSQQVIPRDMLETFGNHLPAQWEDCLGD